jgi:hypothetical protein
MTDENILPWTKRESIEAMTAEYRPFQYEDMGTWSFSMQVSALCWLALGKKSPAGFAHGLADCLTRGIPFTALEDAVFARLGRVLAALCDGRDPDTAYDVPLRGEMH